VLYNGFCGIFKALEVTLYMSRWKDTIAIDVDKVDIRFCETQQSQLLAGLPIFRKMAVFAYITRVFAITGDTIVFYKTLATMLTGIGSFAWIYVVAVVQGDLKL